MASVFQAVDVIILAGGQGTRLRPVLPSGVPKPIAPVNGTPFVVYLALLLYAAGARRLLFSLGHGAEQCSAALGKTVWPSDLEIAECREQEPLGTGGAIVFSLPYTTRATLLVVNGDTLGDFDVEGLFAEHRECNARITIALAKMEDTGRYGRVEIDDVGHVVRFVEKSAVSAGPGYINAGLYLIEREALEALPRTVPLSWERDVLEGYCGRGLYGRDVCTNFIDIGTPESYRAAEAFVRRFDALGGVAHGH